MIISPAEGLRLIDVPQTGQAIYTSLELLLLSNHEEAKWARVWVNDVGPAFCLLTPDIKQDCGQLPLISQGPQTVRVEIDIMNGDEVYTTQTYSVSLLWEPYEGWDIPAYKLAQIVNKNNPAAGYKLFALILVIGILLGSYFLSRRSWIASILGGETALLLLAIAYAFSGSTIAQAVAMSLVALFILSVIVGYAAFRYYQFRLLRQRTITLPPDSVVGDFHQPDDFENDDIVESETTVLNIGGYLPSPHPKDPKILS